MARLYPYSSETPLESSNQYYGAFGRPYAGNLDGGQSALTPEDVRRTSGTLVRGCYGLFDTAQKGQTHFARTLDEVLTKVSAQEFRLVAPAQYHWINTPQHGVRPLVFLQWMELSLAPQAVVREAMRHDSKRFLSGKG